MTDINRHGAEVQALAQLRQCPVAAGSVQEVAQSGRAVFKFPSGAWGIFTIEMAMRLQEVVGTACPHLFDEGKKGT